MRLLAVAIAAWLLALGLLLLLTQPAPAVPAGRSQERPVDAVLAPRSPTSPRDDAAAASEVEPAAANLVTHGDRQLVIHYDLDDAGLQKDIGEIPLTPLKEGIRLTLEAFRKLHAERRLDVSDLDAPKPATPVVDEP